MGAEYTGGQAEGPTGRVSTGQASSSIDRVSTGRTGDLTERISTGPPLLLDGATGTEIERRGLRCELPLWSTHALLEAPERVREIHGDYRRVGAELLTANTFRTQRRVLTRAGLGERAAELTGLAVELARDAAALPAGGPAWVAGSMPTLEDCYRPDLVPVEAELDREHAEHASNLARAGVDVILVETLNSTREARAAARAAAGSGLPFILSFVCGMGARLLSGEPLARGLDVVLPWQPLAVGVNCLSPPAADECLAPLRASGQPFGVYAHAEPASGGSEDFDPLDRPGPLDQLSPLNQLGLRWSRAGARYLGGCCGTRPEHIAALSRALGLSP